MKRTHQCMTWCVALVTLLLGAACGGSDAAPSPTLSSTPESITIQGVVAIQDVGAIFRAMFREGEPCVDVDGYEDLTEGAQVVVRDESGDVIGSDRLSGGTLIEGPPDKCDYTFSVAVPDSATHYTLEVGDQSPATYSAAELRDQEWNVELPVRGS